MEKRVVTLITAITLMVILFLIVQISNVTHMTKISAMAVKDGYQIGNAKINNDPSLCNQIKNELSRQKCLNSLVYSNKEFNINEFCKKIKENCIVDMLKENSLNAKCNGINIKKTKESCYKLFPRSKNPIDSNKVCESVEKTCLEFSDLPISETSFKNKNKICNSIKESCLINIGNQFESLDILNKRCLNIKNEKVKEVCYKSRGIKNMNSEITCNKIKNNCYYSFKEANKDISKVIDSGNKSYDNKNKVSSICSRLTDEKSKNYCNKVYQDTD